MKRLENSPKSKKKWKKMAINAMIFLITDLIKEFASISQKS
jgi:predicted methyltransferase